MTFIHELQSLLRTSGIHVVFFKFPRDSSIQGDFLKRVTIVKDHFINILKTFKVVLESANSYLMISMKTIPAPPIIMPTTTTILGPVISFGASIIFPLIPSSNNELMEYSKSLEDFTYGFPYGSHVHLLCIDLQLHLDPTKYFFILIP